MNKKIKMNSSENKEPSLDLLGYEFELKQKKEVESNFKDYLEYSDALENFSTEIVEIHHSENHFQLIEDYESSNGGNSLFSIEDDHEHLHQNREFAEEYFRDISP